MDNQKRLTESRPLVLVTGAAGFIGRPVVARLLERGWRVRAMIRNPARSSLGPRPSLEFVQADMRNDSAIMAALKDVTMVVHLAAAKSDEKDSYDVNVGGAQRLVVACRATGCRRIINISTQSAKIRRKGAYAATKNAADTIFHESGLAVTTLMPSIVYGEELSGVFGTLVKFVQKLPVVPVLGDGTWISAPIHVEDVADSIIACIEREQTEGKTYDLGGPEQISFDALIRKISVVLGIHRPLIHIPLPCALAAAHLMTRLLANSPVTVSNVLGSNQNTDINIEPMRRDLGFSPLDLDEGIRRVLAPLAEKRAETEQTPRDDTLLRQEAVMISRYLLDSEIPEELLERYVTANRTLLDQVPDCSELRFIHKHPASLPLMDAACALLNRRSLLRKKIFIMTAILEASPHHAGFFLRPSRTPVRELAELSWLGLRILVKTTLGVPLFLVAKRTS